MQALQIQPIEPLLLRDGRPFGTAEGSLDARSLSLPMPGTIAGFLRTLIGQRRGIDWNKEENQEIAKQIGSIPVYGPLLLRDSQVCFPAPADAVVLRDSTDTKLMTLRPFEPPKGGCDLRPGLLPLKVDRDGKPAGGYVYWTCRDMFLWLQDKRDPLWKPEKIGDFPKETRLHVAIAQNTYTAKRGMLYSTSMVAYDCLPQGNNGTRVTWSFLVAAAIDDSWSVPVLHTLGGERRLAAVTNAPKVWPSECPNPLREAIKATKQVRMVLATPAIFKEGWRPGWLNDDLVGSPPNAPNLTLRLKAAAVPRRQAVSGWEYGKQHPKLVRWLAPAGSVYFFEVEQGDPEILATQLWLQPVSDKDRDRNDGYGLALWGVWNYAE